MAIVDELTYDDAIKIFAYDKLTGNLLWREYRSGLAHKGTICGTLSSRGYIMIRYKKHPYCAHRIVWLMHNKQWPTKQIDHINRIRHDNRIENLRDVDQSTNLHNTDSNNNHNKTGFAGVSYSKKACKFYATLRILGVSHNFGPFDTAEQAHQAYKKEKALI